MIIYKISCCAILTSLLLVIKYVFGFIPAIEIFTLSIIAYAIFLPFWWNVWIIPSTILLIGTIYGFGTWWTMYWFIFGTMFLSSFMLKKILLKNNIIFGLWCGLNGFAILLWYGLHDLVLFGREYALAQMTRAIVFNLIEGVANLIAGVALFYPLQKIFQILLTNFAHKKLNTLTI